VLRPLRSLGTASSNAANEGPHTLIHIFTLAAVGGASKLPTSRRIIFRVGELQNVATIAKFDIGVL